MEVKIKPTQRTRLDSINGYVAPACFDVEKLKYFQFSALQSNCD